MSYILQIFLRTHYHVLIRLTKLNNKNMDYINMYYILCVLQKCSCCKIHIKFDFLNTLITYLFKKQFLKIFRFSYLAWHKPQHFVHSDTT